MPSPQWEHAGGKIEVTGDGRFRAWLEVESGETVENRRLATFEEAKAWLTKQAAKLAKTREVSLPVLIDGVSCVITGFNRNTGAVKGTDVPPSTDRYSRRCVPNDERARQIVARHHFYRTQFEKLCIDIYQRGRIGSEDYEGVLERLEADYRQATRVLDNLVIDYDPTAWPAQEETS